MNAFRGALQASWKEADRVLARARRSGEAADAAQRHPAPVWRNADPSTYRNGTGTLQVQETPTFTDPPLAGEQYADSIIGPKAPADAFTSVDYQGSSFWIADDDFDSKLAFTLVQIIMALAATSRASGTVITIPAG